MAYKAKEMKFLATPEKGEVSALLLRPSDASHLLVLGHGASTNMRHATLETIAERMADAGIATFRYNFPYMEYGKGRDSQEVCTATVRSAIASARRAAQDLPLLAGGHSFGGRMTSTAASESPLDEVRRAGLLRVPAASTRQARHQARRALERGHGADALLERHARRAGASGSSPTGLQEARQASDAPSPGHRRPRLPHPQTIPQERGGRVCRDGAHGARMGVCTEMIGLRTLGRWLFYAHPNRHHLHQNSPPGHNAR